MAECSTAAGAQARRCEAAGRFAAMVGGAAGQLVVERKTAMSQADLKNEINEGAVEPLLPVEKKLIGWSLGIGIALLIVLIALDQLVPIKL